MAPVIDAVLGVARTAAPAAAPAGAVAGAALTTSAADPPPDTENDAPVPPDSYEQEAAMLAANIAPISFTVG